APHWMRALSARSTRFPPARLVTRKVGRARVLLSRRAALVAELEALVEAARCALSRALGSELRLTARLADTPVQPSRALGHSALLCAASLAGPGAEAVLELDPRLAATLAALRAGGAPPDVPVLATTRFERALLAELLLTVLAALRESDPAESRWRPRLVEVGIARAEAERRLGSSSSLLVELALEGTAVRGRAVLHVPELALRAVALGIPEHRSPAGQPTVAARARLAFSPRVRCGAVWPSGLDGLAGAAVVLPGARLVASLLQTPVSLLRPGLTLNGTLGAEGFRHATAERRLPSQEVTQVDPTLSEVPVELEVELARLPLSLAELGALQPGAIVPLRVSAGDPVFLRAGDRRIARAELVEVEGEVAARVLELLP
ncbi:MAG TPA: FliM/FliN family flagellar motor switch protein, partial [Planctomycetota bacterium]|nr:FliM/FliN family flagellar motor switch protein [Planctomycetota bacterium]